MRTDSRYARHLAALDRLRRGEPPGWPFEPLGVFERQTILIRTARGEVQGVPLLRLTRRAIAGLFDGDVGALHRSFPAQRGFGWDQDYAAEQIFTAALARGEADPATHGLVPVYRRAADGGLRVALLPGRPRAATAAASTLPTNR